METIRLKVTPWRDETCHCTMDFRADSTLDDVHLAIQRELELDNDHLYSFFLSGDLRDRDSEFKGAPPIAPAPRGRLAANARLATLDLAAGHRFLYLFDYGDELVHDLEVLPGGAEKAPAECYAVVARAGTPPRQHGPSEDDAGGEQLSATPAATAPAEAPAGAPPVSAAPDDGQPLPAELRDRLIALDDDVCELPSPTSRVDAETAGHWLDVVEAAIAFAAAPARFARLEADDENLELHAILDDALAVAFGSGQEERATALAAKLMDLAGDREHTHDFDSSLQAAVTLALQRYDSEASPFAARLAGLPPDLQLRLWRRVEAACPTEERLDDLACASNHRPSLKPWLSDTAALSLQNVPDDSVATAAEPYAARYGAAFWLSLAEDARRPVALAALARAEALAPATGDKFRLGVALAYVRAGEPAKAESLLQSMLRRRWLSGRVRPLVASALEVALKKLGRADEAKSVQRDEAARAHRLRDEESGTVRREEKKLGPNEPCSCGSGKKFKKCCG